VTTPQVLLTPLFTADSNIPFKATFSQHMATFELDLQTLKALNGFRFRLLVTLDVLHVLAGKLGLNDYLAADGSISLFAGYIHLMAAVEPHVDTARLASSSVASLFAP
jgi:hypothetical protein